MVRKQNFSRKRQAILEALRNTKIHPTAEWVHQTLKNDYPDLSLGTVYRNLSQFKEEGIILSMKFRDTLLRRVGPMRLVRCDAASDTLEIGMPGRTLKFPVLRPARERYEKAIAEIENGYGYEDDHP